MFSAPFHRVSAVIINRIFVRGRGRSLDDAYVPPKLHNNKSRGQDRDIPPGRSPAIFTSYHVLELVNAII